MKPDLSLLAAVETTNPDGNTVAGHGVLSLLNIYQNACRYSERSNNPKRLHYEAMADAAGSALRIYLRTGVVDRTTLDALPRNG